MFDGTFIVDYTLL